MEAKGLHEFRATSKEELSFDKNAIVKVIFVLSLVKWERDRVRAGRGTIKMKGAWFGGSSIFFPTRPKFFWTSLLSLAKDSPGHGVFRNPFIY